MVEIISLIDRFVSDDDGPLDLELVKLLKSHSEFSALHSDQIARIFIEIDLVIRSLKRRRLLEALKGIALAVVGRGWDQCDYLDMKNTHILGEQKYLHCEQSRKKYQVSLSTPHGQPKALHDRILHASCQGQVVITNDNEYVRNNFDSGNVVFYSLKENDVRNRAEAILNDDQLRYNMARAGQEYMRNGRHGSDQAAKQVLQQLKEHHLI